MEALFTHPLTMAAGGALVSAPIIIHLINRMRFRRVKWAAMEFLLKAQKRMKRKLIIEQLILLMLRCLLVFLVGMLLARFKWFSPLEGQEGRATVHVAVIDDTPSTADVFTADGRPTTAFEQAKLQVTDKIAPAAAQANTPQAMDLLLLSDLANPRPYERLNDATIEEMRSFLRSVPEPSPVRVSLVEGLRKARERLNAKPDAEFAKVVHVVSDLRNADWVEDGDALKQLLTEMTADGVRVHLIDVAHPHRRDADRQPRSSDNVGIIEFRPKARTVAREQPVDFELRVKNYGAAEVKDLRIAVFVNGTRRDDASARFASLPAGEERTELVTLPHLTRLESKDNPLDKFNLVTVKLADAEPGGITADNTRHAVVEVKDRLAVLVIEGRPEVRDKPTGDSFFLRKLLDAFGRINVVDGKPDDLEKHDLGQYACVYLMNVPALKDGEREKLEAYVRAGGGVGIFLGPKVVPEQYNKVLYRGGEGLFPVRLPDAPQPPPTDEEKLRRALVLSKRVLARDPAVKAHPALVGVYTDASGVGKPKDAERQFLFLNIDQYWRIPRLGAWQTDKSVQELYCLPNSRPLSEFDAPLAGLLGKLKEKAAEPKFEKYRKYLDPLQGRLRSAVQVGSDTSLAVVVLYLDRLLCDQINDGDESEPVLREFWSQPEVTDLKAEFQRLRDATKYGDPLYLVKQFGQGRVAVMTTDAGGKSEGGQPWTDWPSGQGSAGWVMVMNELQRYLAGGAADENRAVGGVVSRTFEAGKFKPTVGVTFMTADPAKTDTAGNIAYSSTSLGEHAVEASGNALTLSYGDTKKPGVYLFTGTALTGPDNAAEKPELMAFAYNVDARREGDLRRADGDTLAQQAPKIPVHTPDDTTWMTALKQKRDDFSTRRWLYLFILLVLVAEQAMAVRLSFHTRPEDVEAHAPSAAAAYSRGTAPPDVAEPVPPPEPVEV